jgi:uncharacterized protein (DUF885 family)
MTEDASAPAVRTPTPIDAVAEKWVETLADLVPTLATYIGLDRGKLGDWEDLSPAGADAMAEAARSVIAQLSPLTPADDVDSVTKDDLLGTLRLELEKHELDFPLRDVNVLASPVQLFRETYDIMPTETEHDWANIASRLNSAPTAIDGYIETLRLGIRKGVVPAKRQVREVLAQSRDSADPSGVFAKRRQRPMAHSPTSSKTNCFPPPAIKMPLAATCTRSHRAPFSARPSTSMRPTTGALRNSSAWSMSRPASRTRSRPAHPLRRPSSS